MDKFLLSGWLVLLVAAVCAEAAPQHQHLYLGYVSPYRFLQGLRHNGGQNAYGPYRERRSAMGAMGYDYHQPMPHDSHHDAMPSYGYNPMTYPYKIFSFPAMKFPAMPKFPEMKFDFHAMPDFHFPAFHSVMPSSPFFNSHAGYKPYQPAPAPHHPFGEHFMKMMGFHSVPSHATPNVYDNSHANAHPVNHATPNVYNSHPNPHPVNHAAAPGGYNFNYNNPKGNNYEMSYSKSYSMNMDYNNGKGHMVTKDSSYMNDNGKVYMHNGPAKHYTSHGNGKFMPDNSYTQH